MKSLNEILGSVASDIKYGVTGQPDPTVQQQPQSPHFFNPSQSSIGFTLKSSHQLYPWQAQIVAELMSVNNGKLRDIFILTRSPGGGKTQPVITYWAEQILGINVRLNPAIPLDVSNNNFIKLIRHPETVPQLIWFSPIRELNNQTVKDEFGRDFVELFLQYFNYLFYDYYQKVNNPTTPIPRQIHDLFLIMAESNRQSYSELDFIFNELINNQNMDQQTLKRFTNGYFRTAELMIEEFINHKLIGMQFKNFNTVGSGQVKKPVIITIYESAKESRLMDRMTDVALMVFDEIQTALLTGEKETDKRAKQISECIHYILSSDQGFNSQMAVLTGTANEISAANFIEFCNYAYKRNFPDYPFVSNAANLARIKVQSYDKIRDFQYLKKLVKDFQSQGRKQIAVILFSKNKINEIAEYCATGSGGGNFQRKSSSIGYSSNVDEFGRKKDNPFFSKQDIDILTNQPDISKIYDPLKRKAAISGIGIIYSKDDNSNKEERLDNQIIRQLFVNGQVGILLATDSIGSGMNVNIKEMYIPSVEKMGVLIPKAPLAQLLHRVGRQANMDCTIYTPSEFADDVMSALNATSTDFYLSTPVKPGLSSLNYGFGMLRNDPGKAIGKLGEILRGFL